MLEEGAVEAGGLIVRIKADPEGVTIRQAVRLAFFEQDNVEMLKRALRIRALSLEWRTMSRSS